MDLKRIVLIMCLMFFCQLIIGQNIVYKRLLNVEQNSPAKLEKISLRYTKLLPKNSSAYFFLSKIYYEKFEETAEDKKRSKHLYECLKYVYKAQEFDRKLKLVELQEWLSFKELLKYEAYFYVQRTSYTVNLKRINKKYYLFISNGEEDYISDSKLNLKVPIEQRVDTLFYGLPTGNEYVPRLFEKEEEEVLDLINEERNKKGLSILELDSILSAACRYQAYDMGTQNYFNHFGYDLGADGRVYYANYTFDRIGQFYNKTGLLGENISAGRSSASKTYKGWYDSPGHNRIMFKPENRLVGIGCVYIPGSEYEYYWVLCTAE